MYRAATHCRACDSTDLAEVFNFGQPMPLANNWVKAGKDREGFAPLRVMFCRQCGLAQLGEVVDPKVLYSNYAYVTSSSQTMLRHFDRLTKDIISENGAGSLLEVGANDGRFLNYAASKGFKPCVGVDPAANLSGTIELEGDVALHTAFFSPEWVFGFKTRAFDTILARHCFCHQEWRPFIEACIALSHKDTLICIEVPYVADLLRRTEFDSIYDEHTSYFTLRAMQALLKPYPLHIHGVIRYGIHGGAVLVMLRHNDCDQVPHLSADEMLAEEQVNEGDWKRFSDKAREKVKYLQDKVKLLRSGGHIVSFFGASAKSSVIINACQFTKADIAFVTDNSPFKPGKLVPGTDIPVIEEDQMLSEHPNYAVCGAWNFRTEVLEKMRKWRERGGKFIFPTAEGWEVV